MKLRTYIASGLLLALGGALAYIAQREGGISALGQRLQSSSFSARMQSLVAKFKSQVSAATETMMELQQDVFAPETAEPAPATPASTEPAAPAPTPVEAEAPAQPQPAAAPAPTPAPAPAPASESFPEPAPAPASEPVPAPEPAPVPEPTPAPAHQPAPSALPAVNYGKPGEGHEPEKYPEQFATFCAKLDEQVKLNVYDYCPAIQVLLGATNDEFALDSWMKAAADKGNAAAMHFLADAELAYVAADELQSPRVKAAYEMMKKSADLGYDPSKCSVSECLHNGIGVKKDEAASKKQLMDACKSGSFIPRLRWLLLSDRMKSFEDRERAEVKAEIDRGNHMVVYYMSRLTPDAMTQLEWLRKAAELGNPDAFYDLAVVNFKAKPKESYELLKIAARMHHREALYLLGSSLLPSSGKDALAQTLGLQPDEPTALRLIKTSSAMRSPRAVYFMGRSYYEGVHGMPKDAGLAYRHFSKALALRSPDSGAAMGLMLLRGDGVEQDAKQGLRMITLAANSGYPYGIVLMAYAHYNGLGVEANANRAAEFLQEAAALGMPEAYVYLAYITARGGEGKAPNPRMAESYMRMATVDLKGRAQEILDQIEAAGKWEPLP